MWCLQTEAEVISCLKTFNRFPPELFLCGRSTDETAALFYTLYLYGAADPRRTPAVFNTLMLYEVNLNIFIDNNFTLEWCKASQTAGKETIASLFTSGGSSLCPSSGFWLFPLVLWLSERLMLVYSTTAIKLKICVLHFVPPARLRFEKKSRSSSCRRAQTVKNLPSRWTVIVNFGVSGPWPLARLIFRSRI